MQLTIAVISAFSAVAAAGVITRADYGSWVVSIEATGGASRQRTETVTAVYSNPELPDSINATCHFQGMLNGEVINQLTCDPESFSYDFQDAGYDDGYLYQITLTQTVELQRTNVTVKGTSDKFYRPCGGATGKSCAAYNITVPVTTATA